MFKKDLNNLLLFLTTTLNEYNFADDKQKNRLYFK